MSILRRIRPGWGEATRRLLLSGAAVALVAPYLTGRLAGGTDARWYAYMLRDFIEQERAGHFPALLGQGWYAWNGGVHPFRSAPVFLYLAGIWDLVTLRSLGAPWLLHLAMATSAVAGVVGFYLAGVALAPKRRWEIAALALLYLWNGAWLSAIYWSDAYMTYMAFAALPLVAYGNARSLLSGDGRGYGFLATGLALAWMSHPPIAMLATLETAILQGASFLCGDFAAARWRGALIGALVFAGLSAFYFTGMSELPGGPSKIDPAPLLGLAFALAGLVRGALRRQGFWLVLLAPGGWLLWGSDRPWFWWMAAALCLAAIATAVGWRRRRFDPARHPCEVLLACLVAGAGVAGAVLGPGRFALDWYALDSLRENAAAGAGLIWPIPSLVRHEQDLRLGAGLWLMLILLAWAFCRKRPMATKLFFLALIPPILGLVRVPWVSDFLAGSFPVDLDGVCNYPLSLRLAPTLSAFVAMGGVMWLATEPAGGRPFRFWLLGLLAAVAVWAGFEAGGFAERGLSVVSSAARTNDSFRSENVVLSRYAYDLLPIPSYFSDGPTDPRLEIRLLDADREVVFGPDDAARAMEGGGRRELRLVSRPNPQAPGWLMIEPGLTIGPGEHLLLRFEFDPRRNYAGYLIFHSEHGYREYLLPGSGLARAFGVGPGRSHVISIWNSGSETEHYLLSMSKRPGNDLDEDGGPFATLVVSEYRAALSPVRLEALDPIRATVDVSRKGWLETIRVFLPGYRATVDGRAAPVLSSPEGLAMVPVASGPHRVELDYVGTPRLRLAAVISLLSWAAAGLGLVWTRGRSFASVRG